MDTRLDVVGWARTPVVYPEHVPTQGRTARVEVEPRFSPALLGLEASTHLVVLAWLERADRDRLVVQPRLGAGEPRGVFAVRCPGRPNPLSLTISRILGVEGRVVHLERLDLWDGTPIVDLKPYSPGWDIIPWATHRRRSPPWRLPEQELSELLEREALDAVPTLDPVAHRVIDALRALLLAEQDPRDPARTYTIGTLDHRVDLLTVMTGATFGNRRLRYQPRAAEPFCTARSPHP